MNARFRIGFIVAACWLWASSAQTTASAQVQEPAERQVAVPSVSRLSLTPETTPAQAQAPHSGFTGFVRTTVGDLAGLPRRKSTWVILGIGAGAAAIAYSFDDEVNASLQGHDTLRRALKPGGYIGKAWVQAGAAAGIFAIGKYTMEPAAGSHTNEVAHVGLDLLRASLVTQAYTYGIKYSVQRNRPTGECCSFPSGHASVTFATATVLQRHFGFRRSWPMFAVAGYVATSRLTDNRHFLSDVVFGSALGVATGWTVVGRHGRRNFAFYPLPARRGIAVSGTWQRAAAGRRTR